MAGWSWDNDIPHRLSWADVVAMVKHSPPGSAVFRVLYGDAATWTVTDHLLALNADLLNLLVWFKTKDGQRGTNRPKRIPRPGDGPNRLDMSDVGDTGAYRTTAGQPTLIGAPMTIAEMDEFLKN